MSTITATIIADSVSEAGARLTTFQLRYPLFIHNQILMHRAFSRSSRSMRAVPTMKLIDEVATNPATPVVWGKNRKGMAATSSLEREEQRKAAQAWDDAWYDATKHANQLAGAGVHKQISSRVLSPYAHIDSVVSATDFDGFFRQRCDSHAQPELQVLAVKMARAFRDSVPIEKGPGDWHLPYVAEDEAADLPGTRHARFSVARCARVSYKPFDSDAIDYAADLRLHDDLLRDGHLSPFEHQATPFGFARQRSGNFAGWLQYRQTLPAPPPFDWGAFNAMYADRDFVLPEDR